MFQPPSRKREPLGQGQICFCHEPGPFKVPATHVAISPRQRCTNASGLKYFGSPWIIATVSLDSQTGRDRFASVAIIPMVVV